MKKIFLSLTLILAAGLSMAQTMTELAFPKYFAGKTAASANNGRIPVFVAVQFSGLTANQSYDIRLGLALTTDAASSFGAGNYWNGSAYGSTVWFNAFTTDAGGNSGVVWLSVQPTGNASRFTPGDVHNLRVGITPNGSAMVSTPTFVSSKTMTALDVNASALTVATTDDAAFIKGNADPAAGGNFVFVYDNQGGLGDPISIGVIRQHSYNQAGNNALPANIDSILKGGNNVNVGDYALVIPISANNTNGIRRVESRSATNTLISSATSSTGSWPSGANSNALLYRDILNITSQDALLAPIAPTITVGTLNFNGNFGTIPSNTNSAPTFITVGGTNLTGDIFINIPAPFEGKTGANSFSHTVILSQMAGTVSATTIELRFSPAADAVYTDSVSMTSPGASTKKLFVSGTAAPLIPAVEFLNVGFVQFSESGVTAEIPVVIKNRNGNNATVTVVSNPVGTALEGSHFTFSNSGQVVFGPTDPDTLNLTINIVDDAESGPRVRRNKFGLQIQNGIIGTNDSLIFELLENDFEKVKISYLKRLDANGVIVSNDSIFEITGTVHGSNTRTLGASFTIIDDTDGISTFSPASASTFGYTITEGDSVMIRGHLTQFNGLAQLDFLDTIKLIAASRPLRKPVVVNTVTESDENNLVRINKVRFVNSVPNWVSGNNRVFNTQTNDTFEIRLVANNPLVNTTAPTGDFDVIGLGSQFDGTLPYTSGYQLFPRYAKDILQDSLSAFDLVSPVSNITVTLEGDATQTITASWTSSKGLLGMDDSIKYHFLIDLPSGDFSSPLLDMETANSGTDTFVAIDYTTLLGVLGNVAPGDSLILKWTALAEAGTYYSRFAGSEHIISLKRGIMNGVFDIREIARVYPNPASRMLNIELSQPVNTLTLVSMLGEKLQVMSDPGSQITLSLDGLPDGVYIVIMESAGQQFQQKIVVYNR